MSRIGFLTKTDDELNAESDRLRFLKARKVATWIERERLAELEREIAERDYEKQLERKS